MITDLVLANQLLSMATVFRISETVSVEYRDYGGWFIFDYDDETGRYQRFGNGDPMKGFELAEVAVAKAQGLVLVLQLQAYHSGKLCGVAAD